MSRRFSADNSEVRYPVTASSDHTGAFSKAFMVRRRATGAWHALDGHHSSGGTGAMGVEFSNTNKISYTPNNIVGSLSTATFTSTTIWWIIVLTKTAGSSVPRGHYKDLSTPAAWVHENLDTSVGNPSSQSGGTIRMGEYADTDDANMNVSAHADWGSALSDGECEELTADLATWVEHSVAPVFVFQHNQASASDVIEDLTGNGHDSVTINGTTMEAGTEPPGIAYYTAGGGGVTVKALAALGVG